MNTSQIDDAKRDREVSKAVQILGLKSAEEVRSYETAFKAAQKHLMLLIQNSQSSAEKEKHESELIRLETALLTVEKYVEEKEERERAEKKKRPRAYTPKQEVIRAVLLLGLAVIALLSFLAWLNNKKLHEAHAQWKKEQGIKKQIEVGYDLIEKREWVEAAHLFEKVREEYSEEELAQEGAEKGLSAIEKGKKEEIAQQVTYLLSAAEQAIEDREWELAQRNLDEAIAQNPGHAGLEDFQKRLEKEKGSDRLSQLLSETEEAQANEQWASFSELVVELEKLKPDHPKLADLRESAKKGVLILEERARKAQDLYQKAVALDTGEYSKSALELLEEALHLSPTPESQALYDRLSKYKRTLKVPGEFKTITEALNQARSGDRVTVAAGIYEEVLRLSPGVEVRGAGVGKTVVECPAVSSSLVNVIEKGDTARVVDLTLRHTGNCLEEERSPVVLVERGHLQMDHCEVLNSGGHGVAVIEGGYFSAKGLHVKGSSWDGVSVYGEGSRATLKDLVSEGNLHHGVDVWAGGQIEAESCRFKRNNLVGLLISSPQMEHVVKSCSASDNREVGFMIEGKTSAILERNFSQRNSLGGYYVRGEGTQISMRKNNAEHNEGAGILIGSKVKVLLYEENLAAHNRSRQEWLKADLKPVQAEKETSDEVETVPPALEKKEELSNDTAELP